MNVPKKCDVVVIGGGPSGSTVATMLSQRGYEVVLFDKVKHPRYSVGESIIPHFWKYCEDMKVDGKIEAEDFIKKDGGTVVWNGVIRQLRFKDFGYKRPALHVERDRFDHILLEHSRSQGARVFEEVTAIKADLPANDGGPTSVEYRVGNEKATNKITCRYVVDATGQHALLAKQLGIRVIDEGFRFMSFWGYFEDSKYVAVDGKAHDFKEIRTIPPTTFVSNIEQWSWVWHIPMRKETSVGLVVPQEQMKAIKDSDEALEEYFRRQCREIPYLNRLLEGAKYCEGGFHVIRNYSYSPVKIAGPGFFMVGDAAAFIDPIFSLGVVLAMFSASSTVWALDRCIKHPERIADSQALLTNYIARRLEVGRALALPRYGYGGKEGEMAKTAIQYENALEQELMYVVSLMTTRSENFAALNRNKKGGMITSDKYRVLETIEF